MQAVSKGCVLRAAELRYRNTDTQSELLARIATRITEYSYGVLPEEKDVCRVLMTEVRHRGHIFRIRRCL